MFPMRDVEEHELRSKISTSTEVRSVLVSLFMVLLPVAMLGTYHVSRSFFALTYPAPEPVQQYVSDENKDVFDIQFSPVALLRNDDDGPKYTRSPRAINALEITDVVPEEGKLIVADLENKEMQLYRDGEQVSTYPIQTFGRPGTPWETPAGMYSIHTKEPVHFSSIAKVYMPYSMQFYGNYFIHGRTYYPDGTLTHANFSGGCIKLDTDDAAEIFAFADIGTDVFVYDPDSSESLESLVLDDTPSPLLTASAYLVADLDTGDVFMEHNADAQLPIASITKLMTAIVANETISYNRHVALNDRELDEDASGRNRLFVVEELMYPLLMGSNDEVADTLAGYLGRDRFVRWMNNAASAYNMNDTTFVDAAGSSLENQATADDLFRLAWYITNKKTFALDITREEEKSISAVDGSTFTVTNVNTPAHSEPFNGGKAGLATSSDDTMLSLLTLDIDGEERTALLVVLGSRDRIGDIERLASWIESAAQAPSVDQAACLRCRAPAYRKIELP